MSSAAASSRDNNLIETLMLCNYDNNDNDNNGKDNLVQFARNASLTLSCLCGHIGSPMNMAAAVAANANS